MLNKIADIIEELEKDNERLRNHIKLTIKDYEERINALRKSEGDKSE